MLLSLLRSIIIILNSNPTSLSFLESWLFNMVSKLGLAPGDEFETSLYNLNFGSPLVYLKVHGGLYFVCLIFHVRVWGHT